MLPREVGRRQAQASCDHGISVLFSTLRPWRLIFHCVYPWELMLPICWDKSWDMLSRTQLLALGRAGPKLAREEETHLAQG